MMAFRLVVRQVFSTNDAPDQNGCGRQETNGPTVRMLVRMFVVIVGGAPGRHPRRGRAGLVCAVNSLIEQGGVVPGQLPVTWRRGSHWLQFVFNRGEQPSERA